MEKRRAYESFVYHGERIFTPTGRKDSYHEEMRSAWARAVDTGFYRSVPGQSAIEADRIVRDWYRKGERR